MLFRTTSRGSRLQNSSTSLYLALKCPVQVFLNKSFFLLPPADAIDGLQLAAGAERRQVYVGPEDSGLHASDFAGDQPVLHSAADDGPATFLTTAHLPRPIP